LHSSNKLLLESVLKEVPGEDDASKLSGPSTSHPHFIWGMLLQVYASNTKEHLTPFSNLWKTVVESTSL
jgi:DNA polymerase phi